METKALKVLINQIKRKRRLEEVGLKAEKNNN